ncbi:hypothetical protein GYMLUDRAFT_991768 [Collybiopsis luxurians FD-317 M1]|uniref:Uncharacterized protein n=1 Tax=Collybiopsis luxurians FD-317 M1 TaxID=944289 RepID=A0A0D0C5I6_9AGAR|nr:hypothetical protein GYMLUDRAFT_991768 [Collybiopsis luxurians FD-317 M1]
MLSRSLIAFGTASVALAAPAVQNIQCSQAVNGTLQLVMLDNPSITHTGALFQGPNYIVDGVEAHLLKIFAPQNYQFAFNACNSMFMRWEQSYSDYGITFLYGQPQDVETGLCVTASQLGGTNINLMISIFSIFTDTHLFKSSSDYITTQFYAADCGVLNDKSQLHQFFRLKIQPTESGETDRDPQPSISFLGVPKSSNPTGVEQYSFLYDHDSLATGDSLPDVIATNLRTDNSDLGFFAPSYSF